MDEGDAEDVELIDDSDKPGIAVDGWNLILMEPEGKIFWEDLFEMDVRTQQTTQQQSEPLGILEGQEEERVCEEPEAGGEAGRESVKELDLRLNKRMDDGFALRDETIRLLEERVKELEQDKIQRENWSFQFGEYVTGEASGGTRRVLMLNLHWICFDAVFVFIMVMKRLRKMVTSRVIERLRMMVMKMVTRMVIERLRMMVRQMLMMAMRDS
ncbi:putative protein-like [Raphanus sativus]|nr:putative protein-like [Raphanus sativus]